MSAVITRGENVRLLKLLDEQRMREERARLEGSLYEFYKAAWETMDPSPFTDGWHLQVIAEHLEAVSYGWIRKLCINLPPRHSKPVAHDALVLTRNKGLIRLDEVLVGDEILTHLGNWKPVLAVHRQGILPVVRVLTESGREVDAAPDHPFLTPNGWVEAGKLQPDDVVGVVPPRTTCGANTVSRDEARLLGYIVGDGSTTHSTPNITCADDAETLDIIKCIEAVGFVPNEQRYRIASTGSWLRRVSIRSARTATEPGRRTKGYLGPVRRWLSSHGLMGCSSYTKMAPPCIMHGTDDIVADFIGAYWSCDGFIQLKGRKKGGGERDDLNIGCDSVNKAFMLQMQVLLARLGINSRVRRKTINLKTKKQGDTYTSYTLLLRSQDDCYRFAQKIRLFHSKSARLEYQYKRRFDFDRPIWGDTVVSVTPAGEKECLCLTVADDQSFTANGIAVHNTLLVSVAWNAWAWCREPDEQYPLLGPAAKFMCLSYGDQLAMDNATLAHRLVTSPWYQQRWGNRVVIAKDQDAKNKFDTTASGTRISGSFMGTVTGRGAGIRVYDDPHKMDEVESEAVRERVLRLYNTTLKSRITDPKTSAEALIAQRGHQDDLSNHFLRDPDVVHLNLPAEYDSTRHCVTVLKWKEDGKTPELQWEDPRRKDGELLWPERFGAKELKPFKINAYEWSAQWQQAPVPRGGGLFKDAWWQCYEIPSTGVYEFGEPLFTLASLDTAFKEKEENDYSALTVWVVYDDPKTGNRRIMMTEAWARKLPLHGNRVPRHQDEDDKHYIRRASKDWGLCEWVAFTLSKRRVNTLIIEDSARGHDVNNELRRLYANQTWSTQLVPVKGDKWVRAQAVISIFTDEMVYAPGEWRCHAHHKTHCPAPECKQGGANWEWRDWVQETINELSAFPHGLHDDRVDSVTMALAYLRRRGLAIRREERQAIEDDLARYRKPLKPLY